MNTIQLILIVSTFSFAMGILLDWVITTHGKTIKGNGQSGYLLYCLRFLLVQTLQMPKM